MTARERLAGLMIAPELIDALEQLVAEEVDARVARALATARPVVDREWVPVAEAAKLLGCSTRAARVRVARDQLDGITKGRRVYVSARSLSQLAPAAAEPVRGGR